jgi:Uma2 family endonuclease
MARHDPYGPLRSSDIREGDYRELRDGHAIVCQPAGKRHSDSNHVGARVLATDPAVREKDLVVGIDAGIAFNHGRNLRAPDISVGLEDREPGWAHTLPPLAVEYADRSTDEADLTAKIGELLGAGTRLVWVVRLVGPLRVEVHAVGEPTRVVDGDGVLTAPGVLRNPVPVRALVDASAADTATLRNLLQLQGYADLDDFRDKIRDVALCEATAGALVTFLTDRGLPMTADEAAAISGCTDHATLQRWLHRAVRVTAVADLFAD